MQNVSAEFATTGDIKVAEGTEAKTLGPAEFLTAKVTLKVHSTGSGVVYGTIFCESDGALDGEQIHMNQIQIDISEFLEPSMVDEDKFRKLWLVCEWENKIVVNTDIRLAIWLVLLLF